MSTEDKPQKVDLELTRDGFIFTLRALSDEGQAWMDTHLQAESWQYLGTALCIDHHMVEDIVNGAKEEGLVVQ